MVTDEEIKKIINDTLDERKKRLTPKVFHNPQKAEVIVYVMGICLMVAIVVPIMFYATPTAGDFSIFRGDTEAKQFEKIVLNHSSCESLKLILHDLNAKPTSLAFDNIIADIKTELTASC